ncbi:uncharacterized protein LOC134168285 isoform X2 [Pezoporus occidentalis]|uniref:uncharacterized protein LOC134168285 isoform X2 n=1 Tax=Pezoporus occidentalis TaxID=407982 RepID=UPI002F913D2C
MWRLARAGAARLAAAGVPAAPLGGHGGWYEWWSQSPPVHWAEGGLTALQASAGLPWWAAIACGAALLRTAVTLPLAAHQCRLLAKLENLQPEIKNLAERLRYEVSVRGKQLGWSEKVASSGGVLSRRSAVVHRPHGTRLYMDSASFTWACEFADSGDLCCTKDKSFQVPEAYYKLLSSGVSSNDPCCCDSPLFHGVVLAVFQLRGTLSQPVAAVSSLSSTVLDTKDQIRNRYSLQGYPVCLGYQIQFQEMM